MQFGFVTTHALIRCTLFILLGVYSIVSLLCMMGAHTLYCQFSSTIIIVLSCMHAFTRIVYRTLLLTQSLMPVTRQWLINLTWEVPGNPSSTNVTLWWVANKEIKIRTGVELHWFWWNGGMESLYPPLSHAYQPPHSRYTELKTHLYYSAIVQVGGGYKKVAYSCKIPGLILAFWRFQQV